MEDTCFLPAKQSTKSTWKSDVFYNVDKIIDKNACTSENNLILYIHIEKYL